MKSTLEDLFYVPTLSSFLDSRHLRRVTLETERTLLITADGHCEVDDRLRLTQEASGWMDEMLSVGKISTHRVHQNITALMPPSLAPASLGRSLRFFGHLIRKGSQ
jgi:hypothetical protein